ncbi:hypothetical protein SAMD00019534_003050 [Acytostelium subglobosum LB1]|uniref:hypothetical protein n=1 Tax=Acytostelium subglobosum LB1 TaxID=1410327 RepID=UPI0006451981|nr:hypothetical protein SAMD00019534_003050 [Acytostelium subglobosum LB1]GAM17130.1 hypothetical protein SAMD00019534_003050 [Acytostelium subglobosum LB1]|eukprot:XP_012759192.1 hypothetical protein SAMD00019534_003050 [Acytostelium subglobosum LB1]
MAICQSDIDRDTFDLLCKRFHITSSVRKDMLKWSVDSGNLHILESLIGDKQTNEPISLDTDQRIFSNIPIDFRKTKMISYLFQNDYINRSTLSEKGVDLSNLFASRSSRVIRSVLDPLSYPSEMIDLVRSNAHMFIVDILLTGDQQLIDELIAVDDIGVKYRHKPYSIITNKQLLSEEATMEQQWRHVELLIKYKLLAPGDGNTLHRAKEAMAESKALVNNALGAKVKVQALDCISDEQRLVYVKLLKQSKLCLGQSIMRSLLREYVSTGDCMLIPLIMMYPANLYDNRHLIFANIVEHGTIAQAEMAMALLNNSTIGLNHVSLYMSDELKVVFTNNNNSFNKIDILNYLNKVIAISSRTLWQGMSLPFQGTTEILECLLSDTNMLIKLFRCRWQ